MGLFLYKGLKKPLVFFGLKDKYIYYAMGTAVGGLFCAAIFSSLIGIFGTVLGFILAGSGIYMIYKIQDRKGLYNKTKNHEQIHIFPKRFNLNEQNNEKEKN